MHILFHFVLKNKNKKWLLGTNNKDRIRNEYLNRVVREEWDVLLK